MSNDNNLNANSRDNTGTHLSRPDSANPPAATGGEKEDPSLQQREAAAGAVEHRGTDDPTRLPDVEGNAPSPDPSTAGKTITELQNEEPPETGRLGATGRDSVTGLENPDQLGTTPSTTEGGEADKRIPLPGELPDTAQESAPAVPRPVDADGTTPVNTAAESADPLAADTAAPADAPDSAPTPSPADGQPIGQGGPIPTKP